MHHIKNLQNNVQTIRAPNNVFDTQTDKSYKSILASLNTASKEDVYLDLMQHEQNVISAVNDMANSETRNLMFQGLFENMSIVDLIALFANQMKNIFTEVVIDHDYRHVFDQKDRKLFIGVFLVLIAVIFYFLDSL